VSARANGVFSECLIVCHATLARTLIVVLLPIDCEQNICCCLWRIYELGIFVEKATGNFLWCISYGS
jgi:hypothetical protein